MNAKKEVRGIEAINPAKREDLFAISEIVTAANAVIKVFIKRYIISKVFTN